MRLVDKVCIVTGGGSGIGRAISQAFLSEGARVIVSDKDGARAEQTVAREAGKDRRALAFKADVTDFSDVDELVGACIREFGRVDVLVNNAGVGKLGNVTELSELEWEEVIAVNLKGPFLCSKRVLPEMMRARTGSIVNIASVAGVVASPGRAAYCASKAGLLMLSKAMALDYAKYSIRINAICPGVIVTPMTETSLADPAVRQEKLDKTPIGRLGMPEDIVPAAVYLASDESSFVTGHALVVDGGWSID